MPAAHKFKSELFASDVRQLYFVFDFDGTLVDFNPDPQKVALSSVTRESLFRLQEAYPNNILVLSGRSLKDLEKFFAGYNISLTGEHGAESNFMQLIVDRKSLGLPALASYLNELTSAYRGSFVEEKNYSKVFHYRRCEQAVSDELARSWVNDLNVILQPTKLKAYLYSKVIEIKPIGLSKCEYVALLKKAIPEGKHIICFGDDVPDQEIFDQEKGQNFTSIGVGDRIERATYIVKSPSLLETWLHDFSSNKVSELKTR